MKVFVIAGEASGDLLGAAVMDGLRQLVPDVCFVGVGGAEMTARGFSSLFPMDELSVMGLAEVLPRYPALRRRMVETVDAVLAEKPDILLTIDSPDFCLRVAKRVRAVRMIRTVHYVAPSVWAWRAGRAQKMARHVDQVLALLPFEPPYMEAAGLRCDFVGHPIATQSEVSPARIAAFRSDHGLGDAPVLLVLPGSRQSEVARLAPIFGAALRDICDTHPELRPLVIAAPGRADQLAEATADWPQATSVLTPSDISEKQAAFAAADAALAASGTVSLELAAARTPMVIAYTMSWLSWQILSRMVRVDTVTLVNLIVGEKIVPEFLGPACRAKSIANAVGDLLDTPNGQTAALTQTMEALGKGGEPPGLRAARAILDGMKVS
ncbi:lipid-A-disaccharide synthase [Palleronia caenipelagi]|uniref:lipid-A-disaccharide synthase n=1 Tax=Palleronia caenipelagi TaxID=2489174 RepID=UPI001FE439F6|nr:lipid-A-disaccharide synthase [Palleronia caenipelagi]